MFALGRTLTRAYCTTQITGVAAKESVAANATGVAVLNDKFEKLVKANAPNEELHELFGKVCREGEELERQAEKVKSLISSIRFHCLANAEKKES